MNVMPIVYVRDMDASIDFYERLGFEARTRSPMWTELAAGEGSVLALHGARGDEAGTTELALVAEEPLEQVAERVRPLRGIADETFGRSLVVEDPDGLRIQVNEHEAASAGS